MKDRISLDEIVVCQLCNSRWSITTAAAHLIQQHDVKPKHISMYHELVESLFVEEENAKLDPNEQFVENFHDWQKRFSCPSCKTPTMDFTIGDDFEAPYICTRCKALFDFKILGKK